MDDAKEFVAIIVGAGPAGLAAEVYINMRYKERVTKEEKKKKNPRKLRTLKTIIIEKSDVTAPLWRNHTYDNITLQGPKSTCKLPGLSFDNECPEYPRRRDFIDYLDKYEDKLTNPPHFNEEVMEAMYDERAKQWEITTKHTTISQQPEREEQYCCDFLVVASGLNAVPRIPADLPGLADHFPLGTLLDRENPDSSPMKQIHVRDYKNGTKYEGKKVLVVGCGDSGIDICGDLYNAGATPYIVVREGDRTKEFYEKAPKEEDGKIKWPLRTNLSKLSKSVTGNRGLCENGNIDPHCSIEVDAYPKIKRFDANYVYFSDLDTRLDIDCVILATGYKHNVNEWLKGAEVNFNESGDLQFNDTLNDVDRLSSEDIIDDMPLFKDRIRAVGFDSKNGLRGIKPKISEVYGIIER